MTMRDGLFHRDIGLPDCSSVVGRRFHLAYSRHAKLACLDDRYGTVAPPFSVKVEQSEIIEVEVYDGRISKVVLRTPHNERADLVIVFIPETRVDGFVKTVWLNEKNDTHATLDRSKYQTYNKA